MNKEPDGKHRRNKNTRISIPSINMIVLFTNFSNTY